MIGDAERIFIFASESGLRFLSECDHWYGDETFKVCPDLFFQLYTIHGQQNGNIYPCVFALLPNKTANTYVRFFQEVFNRVDNQPADILVDFERAAINAIQRLNGNIDVKGCFYHLSSNIWKKIQHLGFQERFQNEADFAIRLKMLAATAFLPPAQVINGFEELTNYLRPLR